MNEKTNHIINLDVGDTCLSTSSFTLCQDKNSMLCAMFSPNSKHTLVEDEEGNIFLDQDANNFGYILNYLRNVKNASYMIPSCLWLEFEKLNFLLPSHRKEVQQVWNMWEIEYYVVLYLKDWFNDDGFCIVQLKYLLVSAARRNPFVTFKSTLFTLS